MFTNTSLFFISIILGYLIFSQHGQIKTDNVGVILIFPLTALAYYQYVKHDNKTYFEFVLIAVCLIHLNLRAIALGARAWLLLPWALTGFTITAYTVGQKKALIALITNIVIMSYCSYMRVDYIEDITFLSMLFINIIIPSFVMGSIVYFKNLIEEQRAKESSIYHKREVTSKMIYVLSSEINDPLMVAKLSLKRFKESHNPDFLKKCNQSVDRITAILKKVRRIKNYKQVQTKFNKEQLKTLVTKEKSKLARNQNDNHQFK